MPHLADDVASRLARGTIDVGLVGMCSDVSPPAAGEVAWTRVCTDPMFVLIDEHHPYAGKPEVSLAELAEEQWLCVPSHGCLEECFVSACVRAGFTPRGMGEAEWTTAVDQVRAGRAVALVEPGQLDPPGVVTVPLAGAPLRRTHYLGWRHDADLRVDLEAVEGAAHRAHRDAVRRSPQYEQWLAMYGMLG
jgi:DNA-binding transcriptional LysR family regulator